MSKLSKQLTTLARLGGGSFKTVADRSKIASRFSLRLTQLNIQVRDIKHIKTHHIENYIQSRIDENIRSRTLQNEMSMIRNLMASAGRSKLADPHHERLSNRALGIAGASRDGTKVAMSNERFEEALKNIKAKDEGVAIVMELARYLGLRNEEAVQSVKSIKTWQQALLRGDEKVKIVFGTKGGRPRETTAIHRERLLNTLERAVNYASQHNGKLIDKPNLHSAKDRYINVMRRIGGLVRRESNHGLRYAYAQDAEKYYQQKGFNQKEAQALVSMDLGHGDGRGDYVKRVYSKKLEE